MKVGDLVRYEGGATEITGIVIHIYPTADGEVEILWCDGETISYEGRQLLYLGVINE
tara:strand:- start:368 stop:538 length:171 start_codon:yes stop_codon:yes gene_type:complete